MRSRETRAAQRESDHQRWADDGGFIPDTAPETVPPKPRGARNPWVAVAVAAGVGLVIGWLTGRR